LNFEFGKKSNIDYKRVLAARRVEYNSTDYILKELKGQKGNTAIKNNI
jgi:hypothetical protein